MEKEMKKLLLVAISVGFFLLVTVTVALAITTPNAQRQEASISSSSPYSQGRVQPAENTVNKINEQPVIVSAPEIPAVIEEIITNPADRDNGDSLTIQIPLPVTSAVQTSAVNNPPAAVVRQPSTVVPAVISAVIPSVQSTVITNAGTARPAAARIINDYWIQTGAYSAMVRAEDIRELLAAKGLISIIENREVNGQNLYRVRLGPYTSEREANHWLAIVQAIGGFDDSQVRQTVRQQ